MITWTHYENEPENFKKANEIVESRWSSLQKNIKKEAKSKLTSQVQKIDKERPFYFYCYDVAYFSEVIRRLGGCWAHNTCAGVYDGDVEVVHICAHCENN